MSDFVPLPNDFSHSTNLDSNEANFSVTKHDVLVKLTKLNPTKANGPDGIPSRLFKENAELLSDPVKEILNSSFRDGCLPQSWKNADVVPLPKQQPLKDINKHLRPISLTSVVSKVAEDFIVESIMRPAVLEKIDKNQFGAIPRSSTTHALVSTIDNWNKLTDSNGSTVRVVLFDFKKAFDLIDHAILIRTLSSFDIPYKIVGWIISFLQNHKQRVKLSQECFSEWGMVSAGVPQGTKLRAWLFIIMINDLDVTGTNLWKHVDDTTISETIPWQVSSSIQTSVDVLTRNSTAEKFQLSQAKCKELRYTFATTVRCFAPVYVNGYLLKLFLVRRYWDCISRRT